MAVTGTECIPTTWIDERDTAFFGMTAALFAVDFTYGAGVLLASYDDDCGADTATPTTAPSSVAPTVTATTSHITVR